MIQVQAMPQSAAPFLRQVNERIDKLRASCLSGAPVTLVAVTKNRPPETIFTLLAAGQRAFGENRVQEAQEKWPPLRKSYPDIRLHLIGPLQSNKVRDALQLFDVIETVDRPALVDALAREREKLPAEKMRCREFYLQVNTGEEPQKAGVIPAGLEELALHARRKGLVISGLMCIPPADEPPAPHFALLRTWAMRLGMRLLSMGMSRDFETAIRMGATHVRIGSALFGDAE